MAAYPELSNAPDFDTSAIRWDVEANVERLWHADPTVWYDDRVVPELADRLGWLHLHETMRPRLDELTALGRAAKDEAVVDVVVCGMGGSSLAPETFSEVFGSQPGYPTVEILDSTHPDAVRSITEKIDAESSWFVISSKSGTTLETLSFMRHFWEMTGGNGSRFIAVTDPGTPLVDLGEERGFRQVVLAPPDVGGRYSALTPFGLVPAALMGIDLNKLLDSAAELADTSGRRAADDPLVGLGLAWGAQGRRGTDKLTLRTSPGLSAFPAWMEQLVAESLGKDGLGIVPVANEPDLEVYGQDRMFVGYRLGDEELDMPVGYPGTVLTLSSPYDLAGEMLRAEVATAVAGEVMGIHPFNQPDVELAKELAREFMERGPEEVATEKVTLGTQEASEQLIRILDRLKPGDYLAVQAYLAPSPEIDGVVAEFRRIVGEKYGVATTFGYGPRFLHSTGQLHKGGRNNGVFLQLVDFPSDDLPVPETDTTFGQIIGAQAAGDLEALQKRDRRVLALGVDAGDLTPLIGVTK
ncbi:MAG: glucose-6-phosphate isomerase [Acidimicrobiia bacterium]|nr:glucose-6-phosphate isomerase [Acidimicrobiia bacterium]